MIDVTSFAHYHDTMLIELERSGWEAFINLVNNLCKNQSVTIKIIENDKETIRLTDKFVSVETYLGATTGPLLLILLGTDGQVGSCYFVKTPEKITIEQSQKQIKSLIIQTAVGKTILAFHNSEEGPQKTYHHQLKSRKPTL